MAEKDDWIANLERQLSDVETAKEKEQNDAVEVIEQLVEENAQLADEAKQLRQELETVQRALVRALEVATEIQRFEIMTGLQHAVGEPIMENERPKEEVQQLEFDALQNRVEKERQRADPKELQGTHIGQGEENAKLASPNQPVSMIMVKAKHALDHLNPWRRRALVQQLQIANPGTSVVVFAGFNEELIREDAGFLQEIHIFCNARNVKQPPETLELLGKLCAPFPGMLFLLDKTTIRLPLYDAKAEPTTLDSVIRE